MDRINTLRSYDSQVTKNLYKYSSDNIIDSVPLTEVIHRSNCS